MKSLQIILLLTAILAFAGVSSRSRAQNTGYQLLSSSAGYQFQVPSDWVPGTLPASTDTLMGSAVTPQAAYVLVKHPDVQTAMDALRATTADALSPSETQVSYTITSGPTTTRVTGADAANTAVASYVGEDGTSGNEYIIAAVRGTTGYMLIVDVTTDFDATSPSVAQEVLGSFQLSGPAAAGRATASAAATAASSPVATAAATAVATTPLPLPSSTPSPMPTPSATATPAPSVIVPPASRAPTPTPHPLAGGLGAISNPPAGCLSYTQGPCVTRCADGAWSSNFSSYSGVCSSHGGEAR